MLHLIVHTLEHCVKLVPFLFVTYLAMEYLEHKAGDKTSRMVRKAGNFGPLIGGLAGVLPQCGFSAAASNLYAGRVISLGTLLAIYLSTSDEMLPILISNRDAVPVSEMMGILALKAGIGIVVGFVVDMVLRKLTVEKDVQEEHHHEAFHTHNHAEPHAHSHAGHDHAESHAHDHKGHNHAEPHAHSHEEHDHAEFHVHGHEERHNAEAHAHNHGGHHHAEAHSHDHHSHIHELCEHEHCDCEKDGIFLSAVKHTLKITFFVILLTFAINLLLHFVGEDVLASMIMNRPILGPVIAGIVGLVPNCASSVAITQLYVQDVIGLGTMMAGLLVNAGIGVLVLFRVNPNKMETMKIIGLLYAIGVVAGIVIEFIL